MSFDIKEEIKLIVLQMAGAWFCGDIPHFVIYRDILYSSCIFHTYICQKLKYLIFMERDKILRNRERLPYSFRNYNLLKSKLQDRQYFRLRTSYAILTCIWYVGPKTNSHLSVWRHYTFRGTVMATWITTYSVEQSQFQRKYYPVW